MKGKLIGLGVSTILIVGVAIGLVVGVHRPTKSNNSPSNDPLLATSKRVALFCEPTDYKDLCVQSLNSIVNNESATPKDYLQVAMKVTIDAIKENIPKSQVIGKKANDSLNKMAFDDCKELFELAIDELQLALANVGDTEMQFIKDNVIELKNWLSATISYQESCLSDIVQEDLRDQMTNDLVNASQLTSNLLAFVSEIVPILNRFGIQTNVSSVSSRKLIDNESNNIAKDDKHLWFRNLLSRINRKNPKPNVIVAQDGSGQFRTISEALEAYPKNIEGRYVIYVKAGVYNEQVLIRKHQINIFMYGDGPRKTVVTGRKNAQEKTATYQTATFAVIGNGFICKSMGFQNTAGPEGHQAVALRVHSDMSAFYNCRMDGYQDTLYTHCHRQFYRNCVISGTVDFIFGDASALIQNSLIIVRKPMHGQQNTVTAQGRKDIRQSTGIVIHNCRIVPEQKLFPDRFNITTYLGRPWKKFSTTVIMQSMLADFIQSAGWLPWNETFALDTLFYAEYANHGPGAKTNRRVRWKGYHVITNRNDVIPFTINPFIQGDQWIPTTGLPFLVGLKN